MSILHSSAVHESFFRGSHLLLKNWHLHCIFFHLNLHQNPAKSVRIITLDPSGSWLVCACMDGSLYIMPVAGVVRVRHNKSEVRNHLSQCNLFNMLILIVIIFNLSCPDSWQGTMTLYKKKSTSVHLLSSHKLVIQLIF